MSRKAAIWVGVVAVATLALGIDRHNVRRIHDENMLKAELFKRDFDQRHTTEAVVAVSASSS